MYIQHILSFSQFNCGYNNLMVLTFQLVIQWWFTQTENYLVTVSQIELLTFCKKKLQPISIRDILGRSKMILYKIRAGLEGLWVKCKKFR